MAILVMMFVVASRIRASPFLYSRAKQAWVLASETLLHAVLSMTLNCLPVAPVIERSGAIPGKNNILSKQPSSHGDWVACPEHGLKLLCGKCHGFYEPWHFLCRGSPSPHSEPHRTIAIRGGTGKVWGMVRRP